MSIRIEGSKNDPVITFRDADDGDELFITGFGGRWVYFGPLPEGICLDKTNIRALVYQLQSWLDTGGLTTTIQEVEG